VGLQGGKRAEAPSIQGFAFAQGELRQSVFHAAIPASLRRGNLELLIAKQRLNLAVVDQLHKARLAFYTALYNSSLEKLRREQRERLAENLTSQEARLEADATTRDAVTVARLQARELDPQIESALRAQGAALLELAEAMGADLGPRASVPTPEGSLRFEPVAFSLDREAAAALQRRPDLKLARLLVRAAGEDLRIAQAGYYPSLQAVVAGTYIPVSGIRREDGGSPHRSDDFVSSEIRVGGAYSWKVVDNGRVGGTVLQQRDAREINEILLTKLEENLPRELARLQNSFQSIAARRAALLKTETVAEENVTAVQENMEQGLASQLEYRDAQNSLLSTRTGILRATYEQNVARAEWDRATGRYFQFSDE
jgi:outer membrane protein